MKSRHCSGAALVHLGFCEKCNSRGSTQSTVAHHNFELASPQPHIIVHRKQFAVKVCHVCGAVSPMLRCWQPTESTVPRSTTVKFGVYHFIGKAIDYLCKRTHLLTLSCVTFTLIGLVILFRLQYRMRAWVAASSV